MLIKLSRWLLIVIVVIVASIYLPQLYWLIFSERTSAPMVNYSPVIEKFIIGKSDGKSFNWYDSDNKQYTREETDPLLPFMNYRLLAAKSIMPDSVAGIKVELDDVRKNNFMQRFRPYQFSAPQIQVYPMFESKPPRLKLEMPDIFFRMTNRMDVLNCTTNEVDEEISDSFNQALSEKGFTFPCKRIFGNPTTRKPFDEGYFLIDNNDDFFQIKMIKGKPSCENTNFPDDLKIKQFFLQEQSLKEFYGYLVSEDNRFYFLTYDNYRPQQLPIDGYDPETDQIVVVGNLFYRVVSVVSEDHIKTYVMNREYVLIDTYEESWPGKSESSAALAGAYIFPFTLDLDTFSSMYLDFNIESISIKSIGLNIVLILMTIFLYRRRKINMGSSLGDILVVLITGIYGFLAILILEKSDR
ncbi:MAG: DUF4857 domain-containing protein [Calditrichaceae bacterium]